MTMSDERSVPAPRVLVVEDQDMMREAIVDALALEGYAVEAVCDGAGFEQAFSREHPALVVVDWGLPDVDGTAIVERVSREPDIGVVMLTGRGGLEHRLQGLERGADAYLVKPVDWRELVLTVRAILRRLDAVAAAPERTGMRFEPRLFRMVSPAGQVIELNAQECVLLECLLRRPGEVVPKDALMEALGAHGDAWGEPRLAQTVSRLRRKFEAHDGGWQPLRTVHRVGYAFDPLGVFERLT
jgi:two-component system OmpR family response regulator